MKKTGFRILSMFLLISLLVSGCGSTFSMLPKEDILQVSAAWNRYRMGAEYAAA